MGFKASVSASGPSLPYNFPIGPFFIAVWLCLKLISLFLLPTLSFDGAEVLGSPHSIS